MNTRMNGSVHLLVVACSTLVLVIALLVGVNAGEGTVRTVCITTALMLIVSFGYHFVRRPGRTELKPRSNESRKEKDA